MSTAASPRASDPGFGPVVVMGVSGCGKSTVGERIADYIGCRFIEGDSLHPPGNIRKMRMGHPLTDGDRLPWLETIGGHLAGADVVISCSSLKRAYRDRLRLLAGRPVTFVFLQGDRTVLAARMSARQHEYMPLSLLDSQLAALELPFGEPDVITIEIENTVEAIAQLVMGHLASRAIPTAI